MTAQPTIYAVVSITQTLKSRKPKKSFQLISLDFPPKKMSSSEKPSQARSSLLFSGFPEPGVGPHRAELRNMGMTEMAAF